MLINLTDEKILDLVLFKIINVDSDMECETELEYLVNYIIHNSTENLSVQDIENKANKMLLEYTMSSLSRKGMVDVNFDDDTIRYSISSKGEEYLSMVEDLKNENRK